jgi:hypothetical protein
VRRIPILTLTVAAASLAACGGGSHSSIPPLTSAAGTSSATSAPQSSQKASASVKITIPAKTATTASSAIRTLASTATRSPQYISASTQSMVFSTLDSTGKATQLAEFDLTPTSPGCSAVTGGGTQCTETLGAPAGTDTFQVVAYDQTGGQGNALSAATVQASLTAGANNTIPLVMDGVPATAQVIVGTGSLPVGTAGSTIVTVQAKDAQGNTIVGPGGFTTPFTLAIANDTWGTLKLSQTSIAKPGDTATLSYNGNSLVGATLNATASNVTATSATVAGSGYVVTQLAAPDYGNWNCGTTSSPVYGNGYLYPYSLAPMGTNLAAEVYLTQNCNGQSLYQDGLAVVTPSGATTVYMGDTPDPTVSPTPVPAPGTTPAPPPGIVVVHGMNTNVQEEPAYGYSTVAALGTKIFYSAAFNQSTTVNGSAATVYRRGIIGVLDTSTNTVKETVLQSGPPLAIRIAPNGNVYFVTLDAYYCGSSGCGEWNATTGSVPTPYYEVGAVDSSGNLLSEQSFDSVGILASTAPYPADMALSPDGSSMYIADYGSNYRIAKLLISGPTVGSATFASLGQVYPYAIAAGSDGNVLTASGYEPSYNYYFSYVPTSSFADASVVSQPFSAQRYLYSYAAVFADGSYWLADEDYGGIGRISSVGSGTRMEYIQNPNTDYRTYLCGVAAVGGAVWGADCDYGGFVRIAYGAPSQNGIAGQSTVRRVGSANRRLQNAQRPVHGKLTTLAPLPTPHPIF